MIGKVGKCCQMWGIPSFSRGRGVVEGGIPGKMLNIKARKTVMSGQRMVSVQIFGLKNSPATRAAERFFKERRVTIHLVDLKQRPLAPGEIKRFIERFGLAGLIDSEGKAYIDAGLKYYKLSDAELLSRMERDPNLLRLPLIRGGKVLSVGQDEESWKGMLGDAP